MWTVDNKRDLLLALEQHGPNNLEEIQKCLPGKSIIEIRYTIEKYKRLGYSRAKNLDRSKAEETSLNQWINLLKRLQANSQDIDDIIPRILKYIALFEDNKTAGINLSECYYALSELSKGEATKNLEPFDAYFLYGCLSQLAEAIQNRNNEGMLKFAKSIKNFEELMKSQMVKSYGGKKKEGPLQINPLKVPEELLKKGPSSEEAS